MLEDFIVTSSIYGLWTMYIHVNLNYSMCYCTCYVVFLLIWNSSTVLYSNFEDEREDLFHVVKLTAIFYLFLSFPLFYYRTNKPSHFFRIREGNPVLGLYRET
jgi:hypothetical protein